MIRNPFEKRKRLHEIAGLRYFTDRKEAIFAFEKFLNAKEGEKLKVLNFYGVGGIGKTTLLKHLLKTCRERKIPSAMLNLAQIGDITTAYRDALSQLRRDLEKVAKIKFGSFDLLLAVLLAHQGSGKPYISGDEYAWLDSISNIIFSHLIPSPLNTLFKEVFHLLRKKYSVILEEEKIIKLSKLDPEELPNELVRSFVNDLAESLPKREGFACRGVLFIDAYDSLWRGSRPTTERESEIDWWVRELVNYCLSPQVGVLVVIAGREKLHWEEISQEFTNIIEPHPLEGFSEYDAQYFLSRCGVGPPPPDKPTELQKAIISLCDTNPKPEITSCHPLFLALCAEIVHNKREAKGCDPEPEMFYALPRDDIASELAKCFLKSLPNPKMQEWVKELSLTSRFDEKAALDLDKERQYYNGRAGWNLLKRFSFVEKQNGFYFFHKTVRDALITQLSPDEAKALHQWFLNYWEKREEFSLAWFHKWRINPEIALDEWNKISKEAYDKGDISKARSILRFWEEITLDEAERKRLGDGLWARSHFSIAHALLGIPVVPSAPVFQAAIQHFEEALKVFTQKDYPEEWAKIQRHLGIAHRNLPTGSKNENLKNAIICYENALNVVTEERYPREWAKTQMELGVVYANLPTGNKNENIKNAIKHFTNTLRVFKMEEYPREWARTQIHLGIAYRNLPTSNKNKNLDKAIECFTNALQVFTREEYPTNWAWTQMQLGIVYGYLQTGNRRRNLDKAIECFNSALEVFTREENPLSWAWTQMQLGIVYGHLPTGKRGENTSIAIECFNSALEVFTREEFPREWARTQIHLGIAYRSLRTDSKNENLDKAIECFTNALEVFTREEYPRDWARVQMHLGIAYGHLTEGDRGKNLLTEINCLQNALEVFKREEFPEDWARVQMHLGIAYEQRANLVIKIRMKKQLLENAFEAYENAKNGYSSISLEEMATKAWKKSERVRNIIKRLAQ